MMTDLEIMMTMLEEESEAGLDMEADLLRLEHELRKNGLAIIMLEEGILHAKNFVGEDEEKQGGGGCRSQAAWAGFTR